MNIRMKAVFITAIIFTLVIIGFISVAFKYLAEARDHEMSYRSHELAELVVAVVADPLQEQDYRRIRELTERLVSHEDVSYITITKGPATVAHMRNADATTQGVTVSTEEILVNGQNIGMVTLGYRNHYADNMASPIGRFIILGTIGLGILAIVTIYILMMSITRPLRKLHEVSANGEPSSLNVFYNDEIEQTVKEVNALRSRMDASYNKLQSSLRDQQMSVHEAQALEERNQAVYNASLDAIIVADDQDTIIEFSPMAEQLFGWDRDEVLGRRIAETIIPEAMRSSHIAGMQHFLKTGEGPVLNQRIELTAVRRSGREFPIEISISSAKTRSGYIFISYIRDITQRRLQESDNAILHYAYQHAPPSLIADSQGHISGVNEAFCALTGFKKRGHAWRETTHADRQPR